MEEEKEELMKKVEEFNNNKGIVVKTNNVLTEQKFEDSINEHFSNALENHKEDINKLTDDAVKEEIKIKHRWLVGRRKVKQSQTNQEVTEEKIKEDEKKHERSKTILKGFGLVNQLPAPYRITALVVGYPFFLAYLCTVGAFTLFLTFVAKGFITMVADCCERFAEVNAKFINNDNNKEFSLGKAIFNTLKWLLGLGVVLTIAILLIMK